MAVTDARDEHHELLTAQHRPLFQSAFTAYAAWLVRRRFHALWVRGNLPDTEAPLVVTSQHVAWWDPLVLLLLRRDWWPRGQYFVMMDQKNLASMKFFRWVGAFGIDRTRRAGVVSAVKYAVSMSTIPRARIVIFPQGRQRPMDRRPLDCQPGASWIARRARAQFVPMALRYEFLEDQHPDLFVSIGAPCDAPLDDPAAVETAITREADALRDDVHAGRLESFTRLLRGAGSRDPKRAV